MKENVGRMIYSHSFIYIYSFIAKNECIITRHPISNVVNHLPFNSVHLIISELSNWWNPICLRVCLERDDEQLGQSHEAVVPFAFSFLFLFSPPFHGAASVVPGVTHRRGVETRRRSSRCDISRDVFSTPFLLQIRNAKTSGLASPAIIFASKLREIITLAKWKNGRRKDWLDRFPGKREACFTFLEGWSFDWSTRCIVFRIKSMQPRGWRLGRAVAPGGQGLDRYVLTPRITHS